MTALENRYAYSRQCMLRSFRAHITGASSCLFCVVRTGQLSEDATYALVKSAESLGYGPDGATFITIDAQEPLSASKLFRLVEGIDPLCIVVADAPSLHLFEQAYHETLPPQPVARVFGREVRLLPTLGELVQSPAGKQQAWAALKTLPRLKR